jgi:dihydroneopterin aldolase
MFDLIRVTDLEIWANIGVTDEERENAQRLFVSLELRLKDIGPAAETDNVKLTVDYVMVAERVKGIAESRPRRLIETLAEEVATDLLKVFSIVSLTLEIRKFVPIGARHVSVMIERPKDGRSPSAYRPAHTAALPAYVPSVRATRGPN